MFKAIPSIFQVILLVNAIVSNFPPFATLTIFVLLLFTIDLAVGGYDDRLRRDRRR